MPDFNKKDDCSVDNYMTHPEEPKEEKCSECDKYDVLNSENLCADCEFEKKEKETAKSVAVAAKAMSGNLAEIFGIMGLVK